LKNINLSDKRSEKIIPIIQVFQNKKEKNMKKAIALMKVIILMEVAIVMTAIEPAPLLKLNAPNYLSILVDSRLLLDSKIINIGNKWNEAGVLRLTIQKENETIACSGILISSEGHALTAAHCIYEEEQMLAVSSEGTSSMVEVLAVDVKNDLALIKAVLPSSFSFLKIGDTDSCTETKLLCGLYLKTIVAPVTAKNGENFLTLINASVFGTLNGCSGSAIIDQNNHIVGIASAEVYSDNGDSMFSLNEIEISSIKSKNSTIIKEFLRNIGYGSLI